jgi:hypothetical protein
MIRGGEGSAAAQSQLSAAENDRAMDVEGELKPSPNASAQLGASVSGNLTALLRKTTMMKSIKNKGESHQKAKQAKELAKIRKKNSDTIKQQVKAS